MPAAIVCNVVLNFVRDTRAGASRSSCVECFLHPVGVTLDKKTEDTHSPSSTDNYEMREAGVLPTRLQKRRKRYAVVALMPLSRV